jgi:hypothetical protein
LKSSQTLLAIAWTLLVIALCLMPGRWLHGEKSGSGVPHLDKVVHAGMFIGFAVLWLWGAPSARRVTWTLAGGLALAVLTELGQALPVVDRDPDPLDALADSSGLVAGWAAVRLLAWRFDGRRSTSEPGPS